MEPDPATAQDATTLGEIVAELERAGFAGQVRTQQGGTFECLTCHRAFDAGAGDLAHLRRLEGASDPADMLLVVALRCPHCETRATAVLNYGPEATVEDAEAVAALER